RRGATPAIVREDQRGDHLLLAVRIVAGLGRRRRVAVGLEVTAPGPVLAFEDGARVRPQPIELLPLVELHADHHPEADALGAYLLVMKDVLNVRLVGTHREIDRLRARVAVEKLREPGRDLVRDLDVAVLRLAK